MSHDEDKRFSFEKVQRLDDPRRHQHEPPERVVEELGLLPDDVLLDLGAGTGWFALPIASRLLELGGEGRVLALDVESRMLDVLGERAEEAGVAERIVLVPLAEESPESYPLENDAADWALLANVYHELPDRAEVLRELCRVLRPGGCVLIVDWAPVEGTPEFGPPAHHRLEPERVEAELVEAGFSEIRRRPLFELFYAVRAAKPRQS